MHFSLVRFPPSTLERGRHTAALASSSAHDWQSRSLESETSPAPASPWVWLYVYNYMEFKLRTASLTNIDWAFLNRLLYGRPVSPSIACLSACWSARPSECIWKNNTQRRRFSSFTPLVYVGKTYSSTAGKPQRCSARLTDKTVESILLFVIVVLYSYCSFADLHTLSEVIGCTLRSFFYTIDRTKLSSQQLSSTHQSITVFTIAFWSNQW